MGLRLGLGLGFVCERAHEVGALDPLLLVLGVRVKVRGQG